jgi:hypothetical protein
MNSNHPGPSVARTAGAVAGGLVTVVLLSTLVDAVLHATGVFPAMGRPMSPALWWLAIGYRAVFTFAGGMVAARLLPADPMRAVWILTGIGTVLGLVGVAVASSQPQMGPAWYAWGVALTGPPCSWLGGRVAAGTHPRKESR